MNQKTEIERLTSALEASDTMLKHAALNEEDIRREANGRILSMASDVQKLSVQVVTLEAERDRYKAALERLRESCLESNDIEYYRIASEALPKVDMFFCATHGPKPKPSEKCPACEAGL